MFFKFVGQDIAMVTTFPPNLVELLLPQFFKGFNLNLVHMRLLMCSGMTVFQAKAWFQALAIYFQAICFSFLCTNWTLLDSFQAPLMFSYWQPWMCSYAIHLLCIWRRRCCNGSCILFQNPCGAKVLPHFLKEKLPQAFMQIGWMKDDFRNLTGKSVGQIWIIQSRDMIFQRFHQFHVHVCRPSQVALF